MSRRRHGGRIAVVICAAVAFAAAVGADASARSASASDASRASPAATRASTPPERRVVLLGLRQRGNPATFASQVSDPSSRLYRHFLSLRQYQERFSPSTGRPRLGSLPPLLYALARGPDYDSIFSDITMGTSSRRPHSAVGRTPAGGAAQPGYDLATGLGSLNAAAFAAAVASNEAPRTP